jgi:hemoglobin
MPTPEICSEKEVRTLVHTFYGHIRDDELLGPVFEANIADWDRHLGKMVDFWSAILRGTGRYHGTPMPKHAALEGLSPALFERWLDLFRSTTRSLGNDRLSLRADEMAQRIAQSLWFGYQLHRNPDASPFGLTFKPS